MSDDIITEGQVDPEKVQTEAKKSFSLRDRLRGAKVAKRKVLIFLDIPAAEEYADAQKKLIEGENLLKGLRDLQPETDAEREVAEERIAALERSRAAVVLEVAPLRDAALKESVALTLRSVPRVAWKVAERKTRAQFDLKGSNVPEEIAEEYNEVLLKNILPDALESITFYGEDPKRPSEDDLDALVTELPNTQWQRIDQALAQVVYIDTLQRAATEDPGF